MAGEDRLLKTHRNEVFSRLSAAGFDPAAFGWQPHAGSTSKIALVLRGTSYFFALDTVDFHWCLYSPGADRILEQHVTVNWPSTLNFAAQWIANMKSEIETPDLWGAMRQERELIGSTEALTDSNPFTPEEQQQLRRNITEIRLHLTTTRHLDPQQVQFITDRLDNLAEASSRVGRKDWIMQAIGTLVNITVALALDQHAARELIRIASGLLNWVTGHPLLLP